jgi:hypothetical protein
MSGRNQFLFTRKETKKNVPNIDAFPSSTPLTKYCQRFYKETRGIYIKYYRRTPSRLHKRKINP